MSELQEPVLRLQAFRFELILQTSQEKPFAQAAGCCRYVSNRALGLQNEFYELTGVHLNYADLCAQLTEWKTYEELGWLNEAPSQALQQALQNLEKGWERYFKSRRKGYKGEPVGKPAFKKKGKHGSFRFPQGTILEQHNSRIYLPKIGWVRYRNSQQVVGKVKNVTVTRKASKWFIAIQTERAVAKPIHSSTTTVGIDLGIVNFAALSTGQVIASLNSFRKLEESLSHAQRAMSHKTKFSKNWKKAQAKVQRIHVRIADTRRDFLHRFTHSISNNHAIVCLEDLRIKNMSASAAGTVEAPGTNVAAKSGLNKSILYQGWGECYRQLDYKQVWAGGRLVLVPPMYTSQTCPECDKVSELNRTTQARFCCIECGYQNHADIVGAINIRRAGLARIACEVSGAARPTAAGTTRSAKGDSTSLLAA